jgi:tetratricopeptide (TPR) repeat protein
VAKQSKRTQSVAGARSVAPASDRRRSWLFAIGIAVIVTLVFLPALRNGFVSWDDEKNFLENPRYRGLGLANLRWMWTTFHLGHYVPLSWMTLGLDFDLWGMDAAGYHATSIVIHALNSVLLFVLARMLFRLALSEASSRAVDWAGACAALLFALHPLRVESVVWITERRDVLSLFFYLVTIIAWLGAVTVAERRSRLYWGSVALFLCALLSKATAMTLPAVLLLLDVYPLRRLTASNWRDFPSAAIRRIYLEVVPFALLSLASIVLSIIALHPPPQLPLGEKFAVSAFSLCFYLVKSMVPTGLSPLYEMPQHVNAFDGIYIACYIVVTVLIVGAFALRKRWPGLVASLAGFILISLPMLGIVQNGPQIAADRYTYHSAPALALFAGATLFLVLRIPNWARFTVAGLALASLTIVTLGQTYVWHDSEVLWSRVLEVDPSSAVGHSAYSRLFFKEDRIPEALDHARRAVDLAPNFAEARNDLGVGLTRTGDPTAGIAEFQRSLALKPTYDEAENNWGIAEAQRGNLAEAMKHYQRALDLNPDYADVHVNIGNLLVREHREDEAIPHYAEALRIRPDDADAHFNWGVALAQDQKYDDAIAHFRTAVAIRPNFAVAQQYIERAMRLDSAKKATRSSAIPR